MNHTTLTKDKKHIDVGPGSKWVDVYEALDEEHLYTIGGRLKTIGVAGLSLLGGHHYFNNKYGYTMDNIDSYDVVLGNGTQVTATNSTNRDLFWALKGGSGNYGLVTNFRIKVYPIDSVSSVTQTFTEAEIPEYIAALCHFVEYADPSIGAGGVFTLQYSATEDSFSGSMAGIQEGNATDPKQFSNFTAIKSEQKILKVMTPLEWHRTLPDTPYQLFRISFGHHSIKPDVDQLTWLYREWREAVEAVRDVDGLIATFVLNPADASAARVGASNGIGNTWDLPTDQGYVLWQITTAWNREVDDLRMLAWSRSLIERLHAANKAKGLGAEYIYLGDAAEWQRPYTGFHAGNLARMRKIRDVYDPSGVFTKLHWGGFKLGF